ncbi:MAG: hypothetical protein HZB55_09880 [Deltaproteobacteria bacterium]|nr:hypothetical protein [Deltaproteobacteria bacterium]
MTSNANTPDDALEEARKIIHIYEEAKQRLGRQYTLVSGLREEIKQTRKPLLFGKQQYEDKVAGLKLQLETERGRHAEYQTSVDSMHDDYKRATELVQEHEKQSRDAGLAAVATLEREVIDIWNQTMADPNFEIGAFARRILQLAEDSEVDYYIFLKFITSFTKNSIESLLCPCLIEKHKGSDNPLKEIVGELDALHKQEKANFDLAADFLSKHFGIDRGAIMTTLLRIR